MASNDSDQVGPVVVGVDGSANAMVAARWAAHEASLRAVPLIIVHAWTMPTMAWSTPIGLTIDPAALRAGAVEVAEQAASEVRRTTGEALASVEARAVEAPTIPTLIDVAADASLLVVGSRGRGGFAGLLLGSVAVSCADHASVPLAVVRQAAGPGAQDIVVGVDDSAPARAALRWAAEEAVRSDRRLVVVHGWETPFAVPPGGLAYGPVLDEDFRKTSGALLERLVAETTADLEQAPAVQVRAVADTAPQALIQQAAGAALLVVGSRGRAGFRGLVLGSVSQQCLHHAPCPVVVVPVPRADQAEDDDHETADGAVRRQDTVVS